MAVRPALRYHGGKWMLAPWIIQNLPAHRIYVEPFSGAGSVLLRKHRSYSEVLNDLDGMIVSFFRVLRDPTQSEALEHILRLTPFAREEFEKAHEHASEPVEAARRMVIRSFMGFGSAATSIDYSTGFRSNSNRSGTPAARDWANYPDGIRFLTERLQGVVIENRPAIDVIRQHDSPATLFYLDPPYVRDTRTAASDSYRHEMTDAQHEELAATLNGIQGMAVLSGYRSHLYDRLFKGWNLQERPAFGDGAVKRTEVLWLNENARRAQAQQSLL